MIRRTKLRLTGRQHAALYQHLFPGDRKEAVALALCGAGEFVDASGDYQVVCVNRISPVPYDICSARTEELVTWSTELLPKILHEASRRHQVLLKIHSHPMGFAGFSNVDDDADRELFTSVAGWLDTDFPGISAIMMPNGHVMARTLSGEGCFGNVLSVAVAGSDIRIWYQDMQDSHLPEHMLRTCQTFGQGTTSLLSHLSIGVVGASGTGSPVVEMLYRLGVGELVLVDGDIVEDKNLGRIYNSTISDAREARQKVHILAAAIEQSGLPTRVIRIPKDLFHPEVVRRLAQCDVLFGCIDSVDGRELLNRLCACYLIPYIDLGVSIDADGKGGVDQVCGTVHYLQPDGSSLLSRGVYAEDDLRASGLRRTDPEAYRDQVRSGYIRGIQEDRPAVISLNTLIASLAVNELLARIHQFRDDPNYQIESLGISLTQTRLIIEAESQPCIVLAKYVGHGDMKPLLNMPALSERRK